MTRYEKIAKALAICMRETNEEGEADCVECPFFGNCGGDESISFPTSLAVEIRKYFSSNFLDNQYVQ